MNRLNFVEVTREHRLQVAFEMSEADSREVFLATGDSPELALMESCWMSVWTKAVVDDEGDCVAIFGYAEEKGTGIPWMLTTRKFLKHRREVARISQEVMAKYYDLSKPMLNFVHAENHISIRWLGWCGFTVREAITPAGPFHSSFRIFTRCADQ